MSANCFSASYIGNKSTHRWMNQELNPAVYIPGTCGAQPCSTVANTSQRRVLSLVNPAAGTLISNMSNADDGSNAGYHALLLSANHRLSRNFSVLVNYTWSHCISEADFNAELSSSPTYQNPANRNADRGNCVVDQRQIFNASVVAFSPRFGGNAARRLFGNWELSSIITKRTGFWFSVLSGKDNSLSGVGFDHPDLVGDSHVARPALTRWFNSAAFQANAPGTFGNEGANSIQGPSAFSFDMALVRDFRLTERHRIEARAEAFNILNRARFDNPRASLTDSNLGQILSAGDPRILQFALKFRF